MQGSLPVFTYTTFYTFGSKYTCGCSSKIYCTFPLFDGYCWYRYSYELWIYKYAAKLVPRKYRDSITNEHLFDILSLLRYRSHLRVMFKRLWASCSTHYTVIKICFVCKLEDTCTCTTQRAERVATEYSAEQYALKITYLRLFLWQLLHVSHFKMYVLLRLLSLFQVCILDKFETPVSQGLSLGSLVPYAVLVSL